MLFGQGFIGIGTGIGLVGPAFALLPGWQRNDSQCFEERDGNDALAARFTYSPGYIDSARGKPLSTLSDEACKELCDELDID